MRQQSVKAIKSWFSVWSERRGSVQAGKGRCAGGLEPLVQLQGAGPDGGGGRENEQAVQQRRKLCEAREGKDKGVNREEASHAVSTLLVGQPRSMCWDPGVHGCTAGNRRGARSGQASSTDRQLLPTSTCALRIRCRAFELALPQRPPRLSRSHEALVPQAKSEARSERRDRLTTAIDDGAPRSSGGEDVHSPCS